MTLPAKEIMIIEDVQDVRMTLRKHLENAGLQVRECSSVEDALISFEQSLPSAILLDLNLNGMSGFDFLKMKMKTPQLSAIPVIVVSGLSDRKSVYDAITLGAQDYLVKPYPPNLLLQKIRKQLKDTEFLKFKFRTLERPELRFELPANLVRLGDASLTTESLTRLSSSQIVNLSSEGKSELGLGEVILKTEEKPAQRMNSGYFRSRIHAIGLENSLIKGRKPSL